MHDPNNESCINDRMRVIRTLLDTLHLSYEREQKYLSEQNVNFIFLKHELNLSHLYNYIISINRITSFSSGKKYAK